MIFSLLRFHGYAFLIFMMVVTFVESSYAIPSGLPAEHKLKMVTCPRILKFDKKEVIDTISLETLDLTKDRVVLVEAEDVKSVPIGAKEPNENAVWVINKDGTTGSQYNAYSEVTFGQLAQSNPGTLPDPLTRKNLRDTDKILLSLPDGQATENLMASGKILENDAVKSFFGYIENRSRFVDDATEVQFSRFKSVLKVLKVGGAVSGPIIFAFLANKLRADQDDNGNGSEKPVEKIPFNWEDFPGPWRSDCIRPFLTEDGTLHAFCAKSTINFMITVEAYNAVQLENAKNCLSISNIVGSGKARLSCEKWK